MPLVENIAKRFSITYDSCGIVSLNDVIQEGNIGLIQAVDRIDWVKIMASDNPDKVVMSFLAKRIKGAIRRGIDKNRAAMYVPEYKLNQARELWREEKDEKMHKTSNNEDVSALLDDDQGVEILFKMNSNGISSILFDSMFKSIDDLTFDNLDSADEEYIIHRINKALMHYMGIHLNPDEYDALRMSYGLDCEPMKSNEIAEYLGIETKTASVRISQIKRKALNKLSANVTIEQIKNFF